MSPDRNVLVGAITAVIMYLVTTALTHYGLPVSDALTGPLSILVGFVVAHFMGQTQTELAAKIDNATVAMAQKDPDSPVNLAQVIDDKIVRQAQLDPESMVSYVIPPVPVPHGEAPTIIPPATKDPWPDSVGEKV